MKTGLTLTNIFSMIFLISCNAAEDDHFVLTGRIENAGDIKSIQVYEGEAASHTIDLEGSVAFHFEGSALDAALCPLQVVQWPYMMIVKDVDEIAINLY